MYDVVVDRYFEGSLKEVVRKDYGSDGSKLIFDATTVIPKNFSMCFLANSSNKNRLNKLLAKRLTELHDDESQTLVVS